MIFYAYFFRLVENSAGNMDCFQSNLMNGTFKNMMLLKFYAVKHPTITPVMAMRKADK